MDGECSEASWPSGHFSVNGRTGLTVWRDHDHDQAGAANFNRVHGRGRESVGTVERVAAASAPPLPPGGLQSRGQSPAFNLQNQGGKRHRKKKRNFKYF